MKKNSLITSYVVSKGGYSLEYFLYNEEIICGVEPLFNTLGVTGEEVLELLGVPKQYHQILCRIYGLPYSEKLYHYQVQDFADKLKSTKIVKRVYSREEIIQRLFKEDVAKLRAELSKIVEEL